MKKINTEFKTFDEAFGTASTVIQMLVVERIRESVSKKNSLAEVLATKGSDECNPFNHIHISFDSLDANMKKRGW